MNAITFLLREHDKVRRMLANINNKSRRYTTKRTMFHTLCQDLVRHETMEQKIWYPRLKKDKGLAEIIKHLLVEEKDAAKTIKKFKSIKTQEKWEEKFSEFKKDVEHHAAEEEKKLFPKVKKFLNEMELEKIGKEMRAFKNAVNS